MQKTKEKQTLTLLLAILSAIPFVLGASLTDSLINSTQSNTTINVTGTIYFDSLIVENGGIYFSRLRLTEADTNTLTFNYTGRNQSYVTSTIAYLTETTSNKEWEMHNDLGTITSATIALDAGECSKREFIYVQPSGSRQTFKNVECTGSVYVLTSNIQNGNGQITSSITAFRGAASTLIRVGLGVMLALFLIALLVVPVLLAVNGNLDWTIEQWVKYYIIAIIAVFLIIILLQQVFIVTTG